MSTIEFSGSAYVELDVDTDEVIASLKEKGYAVGEDGVFVPDNLLEEEREKLIVRLRELPISKLEAIVREHNPETGIYYHLAE